MLYEVKVKKIGIQSQTRLESQLCHWASWEMFSKLMLTEEVKSGMKVIGQITLKGNPVPRDKIGRLCDSIQEEPERGKCRRKASLECDHG